MKRKRKTTSPRQAFHQHRGFVLKGQIGGLCQMLRLIGQQADYLTGDEQHDLSKAYFYLSAVSESFDKNTRQLKAERFGLELDLHDSEV
jgi:hypothetical protein